MSGGIVTKDKPAKILIAPASRRQAFSNRGGFFRNQETIDCL